MPTINKGKPIKHQELVLDHNIDNTPTLAVVVANSILPQTSPKLKLKKKLPVADQINLKCDDLLLDSVDNKADFGFDDETSNTSAQKTLTPINTEKDDDDLSVGSEYSAENSLFHRSDDDSLNKYISEIVQHDEENREKNSAGNTFYNSNSSLQIKYHNLANWPADCREPKALLLNMKISEDIIYREVVIMKLHVALNVLDEQYWKYCVLRIKASEKRVTILSQPLVDLRNQLTHSQQEIAVLIAHARSLSITIIENLRRLRKIHRRCTFTTSDVSIYWHGENYLLKMRNDLRFINDCSVMRLWLGFTACDLVIPPNIPHYDPKLNWLNSSKRIYLDWFNKHEEYIVNSWKSGKSKVAFRSDRKFLEATVAITSIDGGGGITTTLTSDGSSSPALSLLPLLPTSVSRVATSSLASLQSDGNDFYNQSINNLGYHNNQSPHQQFPPMLLNKNWEEWRQLKEYTRYSWGSSSLHHLLNSNSNSILNMAVSEDVGYSAVAASGAHAVAVGLLMKPHFLNPAAHGGGGNGNKAAVAAYSPASSTTTSTNSLLGTALLSLPDDHPNASAAITYRTDSREYNSHDEEDDDDDRNILLQGPAAAPLFWNSIDHNPLVVEAAIGFEEVFPLIFLVPPMKAELRSRCEKCSATLRKEWETAKDLRALNTQCLNKKLAVLSVVTSSSSVEEQMTSSVSRHDAEEVGLMLKLRQQGSTESLTGISITHLSQACPYLDTASLCPTIVPSSSSQQQSSVQNNYSSSSLSTKSVVHGYHQMTKTIRNDTINKNNNNNNDQTDSQTDIGGSFFLTSSAQEAPSQHNQTSVSLSSYQQQQQQPILDIIGGESSVLSSSSISDANHHHVFGGYIDTNSIHSFRIENCSKVRMKIEGKIDDSRRTVEYLEGEILPVIRAGKVGRREPSRSHENWQHKNAIIIQRLARGFSSRNTVKNMRLSIDRRRAMIRLQAIIRGFILRRKRTSAWWDQKYTTFLVRKEAMRKFRGAMTLCKFFRRVVAARRMLAVKKQLDVAAAHKQRHNHSNLGGENTTTRKRHNHLHNDSIAAGDLVALIAARRRHKQQLVSDNYHDRHHHTTTGSPAIAREETAATTMAGLALGESFDSMLTSSNNSIASSSVGNGGNPLFRVMRIDAADDIGSLRSVSSNRSLASNRSMKGGNGSVDKPQHQHPHQQSSSNVAATRKGVEVDLAPYEEESVRRELIKQRARDLIVRVNKGKVQLDTVYNCRLIPKQIVPSLANAAGSGDERNNNNNNVNSNGSAERVPKMKKFSVKQHEFMCFTTALSSSSQQQQTLLDTAARETMAPLHNNGNCRSSDSIAAYTTTGSSVTRSNSNDIYIGPIPKRKVTATQHNNYGYSSGQQQAGSSASSIAIGGMMIAEQQRSKPNTSSQSVEQKENIQLRNALLKYM